MRREGTSIGQFRIDRRLGHGGMGEAAVPDEPAARGVAVPRAARP